MTARRAWSLRRRLVVGIVALLALVSVIVGLVSAVVLRNVLVVRLDEQVRSVNEAFLAPGAGGGADGGGRPAPQDASRTGALVLLADGGTVQIGAYLSEDLREVQLSVEQVERLLEVPPAGRPTTVDLGGTLGEYRVESRVDSTGTRLVGGLPLAEVNATIRELLVIVGLVTVAALAIAAVVGAAVVRVALRPLGRVAATATRVSELPLDRGEVTLAERIPDADTDERTEVGKVGAAINRMLGHVASALSAREASERKVRRFVADASHELRTPLASIRGYAELTRRGGHDLPPDVVHSIGRVESEAVRMTSLVEDLLLLARLDEGRDIEARPVDLSRLIVDTVSDAHAAAPDHRFDLDLPEHPVMVTGDDARLRQVFANLLANARVHTPPGTRVAVAVQPTDVSALVTVADDGPGIPESVLPNLFERFARADSSRSRVAGSTGLGLAIVRAVVNGHGGSVDVRSRPGATTFTVTLPLD